MFNLVYRSKANPVFNQSQILEMLESARNSNKEKGITGCLLYYQGEFIQYLEGNQIRVLQLFDKIKEDSRHSDVQVLSHGHIEFREFDKWEMAYENFLGTNHQLQYLILLLSSYMDNPQKAMSLNPTSNSFWNAVSKLLKAKSTQSY